MKPVSHLSDGVSLSQMSAEGMGVSEVHYGIYVFFVEPLIDLKVLLSGQRGNTTIRFY